MADKNKRKSNKSSDNNMKKQKIKPQSAPSEETRGGASVGEESVEQLQEMRIAARARKDWKTADALRDRIQAMGLKVQDSKIKDGPGSKLTALPKKEEVVSESSEDDSEEEEEEDDDEEGESEEEEEEEEEVKTNPPKVLSMGVKIEDLVIGNGPTVELRKPVKVQYIGKLQSGKVFDKSGNKPFSFRLGRGEVIKGWDIGVLGMRKGGKRMITCPPAAAYGKGGTQGIPPNSTLVFEVTVV